MGKRTTRPLSEVLASKNAKDALKRHAIWVFSVGGAEGLAEFCLARLELGLDSTRDQGRLLAWVRAAHRDLDSFPGYDTASETTARARFLKEQSDREAAWEIKRRQIIHIDQLRRNGSRDQRAQIERCHQKPSAARPRRLTLVERMERSYRRRRYLVTGQ